MDIVIQLIGVLGILAAIISFQCKKHSSILLFRTLNEFIFAVQYFLLGAYTGMMMDLFGCVRNFVFTKQIEKEKSTIVSTIIFSVLFMIFGFVFWEGPKSILIVIAKVLSTLAYSNKNTTVVRGIVFVTSASWLVYNYCIFSIAGVLSEAFTLVSVIVGIVRFDLLPRFTKRI